MAHLLRLRLRRALPLSTALLSRARPIAAVHTLSHSPAAAITCRHTLPHSSPAAAAAVSRRHFHVSRLLCFNLEEPELSFGEVEKVDPYTTRFEGCDYLHWLIIMDFGNDDKRRPSPEKMVQAYVDTCAKVLGSIEEAKQKIYGCSTTTYTGFQVEIDEETSKKFVGLPGVSLVLPDSYIDPVKGDKFVSGEVIPRSQIDESENTRMDFRPNDQRARDSMPNQQGSMPQGGRGYPSEGQQQSFLQPQTVPPYPLPPKYAPPIQPDRGTSMPDAAHHPGVGRNRYQSVQRNYNFVRPQEGNYNHVQGQMSNQPRHHGGAQGPQLGIPRPQNFPPQQNYPPQQNFGPYGQADRGTSLNGAGAAHYPGVGRDGYPIGQRNFLPPQVVNYNHGYDHVQGQMSNQLGHHGGALGPQQSFVLPQNFPPQPNYPPHQNFGPYGQADRGTSLTGAGAGYYPGVGRDGYQSGQINFVPPHEGNYNYGYNNVQLGHHVGVQGQQQGFIQPPNFPPQPNYPPQQNYGPSGPVDRGTFMPGGTHHLGVGRDEYQSGQRSFVPPQEGQMSPNHGYNRMQGQMSNQPGNQGGYAAPLGPYRGDSGNRAYNPPEGQRSSNHPGSEGSGYAPPQAPVHTGPYGDIKSKFLSPESGGGAYGQPGPGSFEPSGAALYRQGPNRDSFGRGAGYPPNAENQMFPPASNEQSNPWGHGNYSPGTQTGYGDF